MSPENPAAVTNAGFSVLTQSRTNHQSDWTAIPQAFYDCEIGVFDSHRRLPCHVTDNMEVYIHNKQNILIVMNHYVRRNGEVQMDGCYE